MAEFELRAVDATYRRAIVGGLDILLLTITDIGDACAAEIDGAVATTVFDTEVRIPGAHVLGWSVLGGPAGARIAPGAVEAAMPPFEGRSRHPPKGAGPYGFPTLVSSDAACQNHHVDLDLGADHVELRLTDVPHHGPIRGELTIEQGGERITGRFQARPCPGSEHLARPPLGRCVARPELARKATAAELEAASQFVPLGMPMGRAGACWKAQLACRPAQASARGRVEVTWMATLRHRPTVGRPFPPPVAEIDDPEMIYWVSHSVPGGRRNFVATRIARVGTGSAERVVYRGDGRVLEAELVPTASGLRRATLRAPSEPPVELVCVAPPSDGPGSERWTYPSMRGDCRF